MSDPLKPDFARFRSRTFVISQENIDTDQIIPARFLTTTQRAGLGLNAFHDWRYDEAGHRRTGEPLNALDPAHQQVIVAGRNFGCGSSREHAAWALHDLGIRVVISSEIADIFSANASKNGILPIIAPKIAHHWLLEHDGVEIAINLETGQVDLGNGPSFQFQIEPFARRCLLDGTDPLGFLLSHDAQISAYQARTT